MIDDAYKRRRTRAIRRAADILAASNYRATILQGEVFNLEAVREREIRKIRVVLDVIGREDEVKVSSFVAPAFCTREIWCKRINEQSFLIKELG